MSDEVKEMVDGIGKAFEEFKATNDERLSQLEKKGATDVVTEEKLERIEQDLDKFEDINQKLTAQANEAKSVNEKLDRLETMVKRPTASTEVEQADVESKSFNKWLRKGKEGLEPEEVKSLAVSDDTSAGFLAPPEYVREFRTVARVRSTTLKSVQMPSRTATFSAVFVAEQGTRSETTGYTTALEEIPTHELYALVDVSEQQLEDSVFNVEAEMNGEFAEQFAKAEGTAFISGSGVGKPEGLLTNSSVSTTASGASGAVAADSLLTLVHSLKSPYGQNGTFIFNRTTLGAIRKLKDTAGQYVFQPGMMLTAGVPNTILGYPYVEMPDMPDVASSAKSIAFGDFSRGYMIVDRVALSVLRDPFTQATSGNVRYVARRRVGGQVILAEAMATYTIT